MINHATQQATLDAPTETLECLAERLDFATAIASLLVTVSSSFCEHYHPVPMLQANTSLVIPVITVFPLPFQKLSICYPYDLLMGKMMGNFQ